MMFRTKTMQNATARYTQFFRRDNFVIGGLATSPGERSPKDTGVLSVLFAPYLFCTNPACGKPFALPSLSMAGDRNRVHYQMCRHCDAPLPVLSLIFKDDEPWKPLVKRMEARYDSWLAEFRHTFIEDHDAVHRDFPPQTLFNSPLKGSPDKPSLNHSFIGYHGISGVGRRHLDFLNFTLDNTAATEREYGIPWCGVMQYLESPGDDRIWLSLLARYPRPDGTLTPGVMRVYDVTIDRDLRS